MITVKFSQKTIKTGLIIIGMLVLVGALLFVNFKFFGKETDQTLKPEIVLDDFGFPADQYKVESHPIKSNQTLSGVLLSLNLSPDSVFQIIEAVKEHFDPRRIRTGNTYHIYHSTDSIRALSHIVYEISLIDFLTISFGDSLLVSRGQKEVVLEQKTAVGVISSSLWNTMTSLNLNTLLAIRLSQVLAWEVDFYRIQEGDRFKVVYTESFVGGESVDISQIHAVYFKHQGREIYGFHFVADTINGFFNKEGDNLRKVFLRAPLEFGRISSRFSHSRLHPVLRHRRPHHGTDYAAPYGTPILSVGDGVVTRTGFNSGNGNYVRIRHNSIYETQYLHMQRFAQGIRPGVRVTQGQVIGYVGSTGLATGPHVCFRFYEHGTPINHLNKEFPTADPLHPDFKPQFIPKRDSLLNILNQLEFPIEELAKQAENP